MNLKDLVGKVTPTHANEYEYLYRRGYVGGVNFIIAAIDSGFIYDETHALVEYDFARRDPTDPTQENLHHRKGFLHGAASANDSVKSGVSTDQLRAFIGKELAEWHDDHCTPAFPPELYLNDDGEPIISSGFYCAVPTPIIHEAAFVLLSLRWANLLSSSRRTQH